MNAWPAREIQQLCEVTSSKRIYASELTSTGVPFLRSKEIIERVNGGGTFAPSLFIAEKRFRQILEQTGAPKEGEILLTSRGTLGVPYIVQKGDRFHFADGNLTWFKSFRGLESRFLRYFFISPSGRAELAKSTIGSSQQAYTIASLKKTLVPCPPILIQIRVADVLAAYDELIENNQRRIRILEEMARSLYCEWFVHFRFPGHESQPRIPSGLGDIPSTWKAGRLDDLIVLQRGYDLPKAARIDGTIPIYAATGVTGFHNVVKVKAPGIVTGRSGTIGVVTYVQEDFWPLNTVLWAKELPKAEPLYAYYVLHGFNLKGFNSGAAVPTLNRNDIHGIAVALPPRDLQRKFQMIAGPMHKQIRTLTVQSEKLRASRDLLLPRLLSGQIKLEAN